MLKYFFCLCLFLGFACTQVVNNVRVVGHVDYIIKVIQETINELEQREWCNLKLPDFTVNVNETVFDKHYLGTVKYSHGFAVSIQHVDIQQSTVQQVWSWNTAEAAGIVSLRGTLRLTDLTVGYDVTADMDGGQHYTATFRHPLISFAFSINYNTQTEAADITVVGTVPRITTVLPILLPVDETSQVLTTMFDPTLTADGINAWGMGVFQPITADVVANRVEFPRICYDCPV